MIHISYDISLYHDTKWQYIDIPNCVSLHLLVHSHKVCISLAQPDFLLHKGLVTQSVLLYNKCYTLCIDAYIHQSLSSIVEAHNSL